jgi:dTDP-4-dehydrorhamnose reductase
VGASVVYISSDYVFDGSKGAPYVETDQTGPLSAYGRTKLAGEEATAAANNRHFIVRSSWLFGTAGRNFVETMLQLATDHGEVLVVRDQVGSPTYTWHLAHGVVRLIEGVEFGIHHMAAGGSCSWYEFAREIFDQAKIECKVLSATTEMLGRPAPRPAYSVLASQREHAIELPSWQDGLSGYLAQRESEREAA